MNHKKYDGYDKYRNYSKHSSNNEIMLLWIVPVGLILLFVKGGWILLIALIVFGIYKCCANNKSLYEDKKYQENIKNTELWIQNKKNRGEW